MAEKTVTRLTKMSDDEMTGAQALVELARDLMASQAVGDMPRVYVGDSGNVSLRWADGGKVMYLTGVDVMAGYVTRG